jgi:hypothetical protein
MRLRRPGYADVAATLALVFALSGTTRIRGLSTNRRDDCSLALLNDVASGRLTGSARPKVSGLLAGLVGPFEGPSQYLSSRPTPEPS